MNITSVFFMFFILPIFLVSYYMFGKKNRSIVLLVLSLLFYSCGASQYFIMVLASTGITVLLSWLIDRVRKSKLAKLFLVFGIAYNVLILFYYKYVGFVIDNINLVFKTDITYAEHILPLGLSFFTFKAISLLVDTYSGKVDVKEMPLNGALYLTFFAQIQSGPISRYNDLYESVTIQRNTDELMTDLSAGVYRFVIGLNKKVLLANVLDTITREAFTMEAGAMSTGYAWLGAICFSLELFFDFSGYSDMAIGLSRMFGIHCPENFDYPYVTSSVSDFWRRWHITLGAWFRDYVYIPMGGSRTGSKQRLVMNLFVVWLFTGIWHGANWNFIAWGLGYFVIIALEKLTGCPKKIKKKLLRILYRFFTLLFINFQWVMFRATDFNHGITYIKTMLVRTTNAMSDERALMLLRENIVFLVFAVLLCMPIVPFAKSKLKNHKQLEVAADIIYHVLLSVVFIVSIAFVVAGQNNPFAYANF